MKRMLDSEVQTILRCYQEGQEIKDIARKLGRDPATCFRALQQGGIATRTQVGATEVTQGFRTCRECRRQTLLADLIIQKGRYRPLCRQCHSVQNGRTPLVVPSLSLTESQIAYLAGLIDGEGHITIIKVKSQNGFGYSCCIDISNTADSLLAIREEFGGIGAFRTGKRQNPNWKPAHQWNLLARHCRFFLPLLIPHLRIKRRQAEIALECLQLAKARQKSYAQRTDPELMSAYRAKVHALFLQMRELNKRGPS